MTVTDILPDYRTYSDEANKDFTFAGALREYIKGENGKPCLSANWNDDTYSLAQLYFNTEGEENFIDKVEVIGNIYENTELLEVHHD